jgi:hypothetical protein
MGPCVRPFRPSTASGALRVFESEAFQPGTHPVGAHRANLIHPPAVLLDHSVS